MLKLVIYINCLLNCLQDIKYFRNSSYYYFNTILAVYAVIYKCKYIYICIERDHFELNGNLYIIISIIINHIEFLVCDGVVLISL